MSVTHQPDWAPEGGWDNPTSTQDADDGRKVYLYADGTQKHVLNDGNVTIVYGGTTTEWQQYSENPSQTSLMFRDGNRTCWFPNGTVLDVRSDGSKLQTMPNGVTIETLTCGGQITIRGDRTIRAFPDDALEEIDFPLGPSYGARKEILKWPKIKTIQTIPNRATHHNGADGTDVQVNPDMTIIVKWAPGNCAEADEHYGDQQWSMQVQPNGDTLYLRSLGDDTDSSTGEIGHVWEVDPYWKEQSDLREAAERAAAASAGKQKEADDELKRKAREMLKDPDATSDMLNDMADKMKQIGDDEAKEIEKELRDKAQERKMEEDLQTVWEAQARDKMKEFKELLDSHDDSEENINKTRQAADEARKWAKSSRGKYKGVYAKDFDDLANDLDEHVKSLLEPDETQLRLREAIKRFKIMLEDDDAFPKDLIKAADEAKALAAEVEGDRKYNKEHRDCEQYQSLLKARAVTQQVHIVRLVETRYKHLQSKFMLMKKFLTNHGVPADEKDLCKRIFEVWETADRHGLDLPITVEGLKA